MSVPVTRAVLRSRGKRQRQRHVERFIKHVVALHEKGYSPATIARMSQTTEQVVSLALRVKGRDTGEEEGRGGG